MTSWFSELLNNSLNFVKGKAKRWISSCSLLSKGLPGYRVVNFGLKSQPVYFIIYHLFHLNITCDHKPMLTARLHAFPRPVGSWRWSSCLDCGAGKLEPKTLLGMKRGIDPAVAVLRVWLRVALLGVFRALFEGIWKYWGTIQESVLVIGWLGIGPSLSPACHFTKIVGQSSVVFIIHTTETIARFISCSIKFTSKGEISGGRVK